MKRFCWALSGILAVALIAFCASSPVSAARFGQFTADKFTTTWQNESGSGSFTGQFNTSYAPNTAQGTSASKPETYKDLCINFPGLSLDPKEPTFFNISFAVAGSAPYLNAVQSSPLTGLYGVTVQQDYTTNSTVVRENTIYSMHTHSITGYSVGSGSTLCFNGSWLQFYGATSWSMTRPTANFNTQHEQVIYDAILNLQSQIQKGINVNATIDKSGLATAAEQQATTSAITDLKKQQQQAQQQQHQDAQAQLDATNKQTEQQKEQYEQDKQEEQEREEQGSESADQAGGIFNFSIPNPFAGIFALFNSGSGCANIPIIAGWLNLENSSYCSWWSPGIRSVLTPVFGFFSMMLLFGFASRWLGGNDVIRFEGK